LGRFSELGKNKNIIISKLIENDDIVKAIGNPEKNFLDLPKIENPSSLIYTHIFPYGFALSDLSQINQEQKTFITMMVSNIRLKDRVYKIGDICLYVFCHFLLMQTAYSVNRTDFIINKIDETLNQSKELGIGELQFERLDDMRFSTYHFGSAIKYKDFSYN
jgi:hypothetical protein